MHAVVPPKRRQKLPTVESLPSFFFVCHFILPMHFVLQSQHSICTFYHCSPYSNALQAWRVVSFCFPLFGAVWEANSETSFVAFVASEPVFEEAEVSTEMFLMVRFPKCKKTWTLCLLHCDLKVCNTLGGCCFSFSFLPLASWGGSLLQIPFRLVRSLVMNRLPRV